MTSFTPPAEDFADLYDEAPCGYVSITPDARIAMVNLTLASWLECRRDDLLGKSIHEILSFGGKIAFETHIAPMLRLQGEAHELALDLQVGDGEKLPVMGTAREKRGPDNKHLFTRLTLFKAVERRSFERSLIEAKVRAEERYRTEHDQLELRDQFIAVLGHDLRNPIAAVEAGARMLERGATLDSRQTMVIGEMRASLARANTLIDDVLDFAMGRLGTGIQLDYTDKARLKETLQQVVHETESINPEIEIACKLDGVGPVDCDPDRIAQLAANLLSNAVRYGDRASPIMIEGATDGGQFSLSVVNRGKPIPQDAREKLFQPFERGERSKTDEGLGLGLFIVNEIAQAHGGKVEVESGDQETRFTLQMPVSGRS